MTFRRSLKGLAGSWAGALAIGVSLTATAANATVYNLANDFTASNPNGAWSYVYQNAALPNVGAPQNNGNPFVNVIPATGYFSTGNNLNANTPDVLKTTGDGTQVGQTAADFLAGDVLVHSPNDGSALSIIWTAPSAGTISFLSSIWYAHSAVSRANDVSITLGGNPYALALISPLSFGNRSDAWDISGNGISVTAGETLAFNFSKAALQGFGSIDGIAVNVDFTGAVPEPSTWAMMLIGFLGLGYLGRRYGGKGSPTARAA